MKKDEQTLGWKFVLLAVSVLVSLAPLSAKAQNDKRVDYYRSPFVYAAEIDPLGFILERIGARFEYRTDPLLSRYFEFEYHADLRNHKKTDGPDMPAISGAYGIRIYLRDNAAIEGLFAGANAGVSWIDQTNIGVRIGMEVGYKLRLWSTRIFVEPEFLIEAYPLHKAGGKIVLPYLAVPFGVML